MSWLYDQSGHLDWRWIVPAVVAAYAAIIATYREIAARRERLVNVKVHLYTSMVVMLGKQSTPHVQVRIENHGRPETSFDNNCASIEWRGADNVRLLLWDHTSSVTKWPHRLESGSSFYLMVPTQPLRDYMKQHQVYQNTEIRAITSDAIGRQFFSSWVQLPKLES